MYNPGTFSTSTRQAFGLDAMDDPTFQNAIATIMLGNGVSAFPDLQSYIAQLLPNSPRQFIVGAIMDVPDFAAFAPILAFDMTARQPIATGQLVQDGSTGPVTVTAAQVKGGNSVRATFAVAPGFSGGSMIAYLLVLDGSGNILSSQPLHAYVQAGQNVELDLPINLSDAVPPGSYTLGIGAYAENDKGPRLLWTAPNRVVEKPTYETGYRKHAFTVSYAVPYGADPLQVMDILQPTGSVQPAHTIVLLHGGGLTAGARASMATQAQAFASAGWVVANLDYRLTRYEDPSTLWPAPLNDVRSAIAFLKANATSYGIDPDKICAGGVSAGAQLAIWLGTDHEVACVTDNSGPNDFTYAPIMVGGSAARRLGGSAARRLGGSAARRLGPMAA